MLDTLVSLLALLALCVFYASLKGVASAGAPLLAVCTVMLYFTVTGMLGLLAPSVWLFYLLCAGLCVYALVRRGGSGLLVRMASPGIIIFAVLALVMLVYYWLRQPLLSEWDEFVFWGTAPKLLTLHGRLYTPLDVGYFWTPSERPGLPVLGWFVQFLGGGFAAWKVYWAYSLLLFACAAALTAPVEKGGWRLALPLVLAGVLAPFFFSTGYHTTWLLPTYLTAYADLPGGMLFGAALVLYFCARRGGQGGWWQALLPLCALAAVKENLFPVALVAAGVIAADLLFFGFDETPGLMRRARIYGLALRKKQPDIVSNEAVQHPAAFGAAVPFWRKAAARMAAIGFVFAGPVVLSSLWGRYVAWAHTLNTNMNGNMSNEPPAALALQAVRELLGLAPKSEPLLRVLGEMADSFFGRVRVGGQAVEGVYRTSMAGTGLVTMLLVVSLYLLAVMLAANNRWRLRIALAGGLMLGGFVAYHFMLLVNYAFLSHTRFDEGIADYSRYTSSYLLGWFILGVCLLGWQSVAVTATDHATRQKNTGKAAGARLPGKQLAAQALALVLAVFMLVRFAALVRPGYSVLDYPANAFDTERRVQADAARVAAAVQPGERLFFVYQGGDGGEYFMWHHFLLPVILDYSIRGGGTFAPPPPGVEDTPQNDQGVSLEEMRLHLQQKECNYILIARLDAVFVESYSVLFDDGLAFAVENADDPTLYRLAENGLYQPVRL